MYEYTLGRDDGIGTFTVSPAPDTDTPRIMPCQALCALKYFLIGGLMPPSNVCLDTVSVFCYSVKNSWSEGPRLNVARCNASSCVFSNHIYIFGGQTHNYAMTNVIERLYVQGSVQIATGDHWEKI